MALHLVARGGEILAMDQHAARQLVALAGQGLDQLALAVARHAGHADDLAGVYLEVELVDGELAHVIGDAELLQAQHAAALGARCLEALSSRSTTMRASRSPTIISAIAPLSRSAAGAVPISRPRRSTVTVSGKGIHFAVELAG